MPSSGTVVVVFSPGSMMAGAEGGREGGRKGGRGRERVENNDTQLQYHVHVHVYHKRVKFFDGQ